MLTTHPQGGGWTVLGCFRAYHPSAEGVVSTLPMEFVSKSAVLLTERVFEGDLVSKTAVLLTERVFEGDLVSKMAVLLTELVFEIDLVSKMAVLLTDKGVRRARCAFMPHTLNAPNGPESIERQIDCARWSPQKHTLHK